MMIEIIWDDAALRRLKKWCKKHPDLIKKFTERMELFAEAPFHPPLKTHPLSGKLEGLYAFSINHSYRVVFQFEDDEQNAAIILNIGTHDEVYG